MAPFFSIITVNLNHAGGLKETLQSTFSQRGDVSFEQLVIDGGSTDDSAQVLHDYQDFIDYGISEQDEGIYQAMNKGIAASKGKYLLFLNSGDTLCDPMVLTEVKKAVVDERDLIYGNSKNMEAERDGGFLKEIKAPSRLTPFIFFRSGICHQAVFFHRDMLNRLGGYNESYRIAGDWELEIRALLTGCRTQYVDRCIACYEGAGVSRLQRDKSEIEKKRILDIHFPAVIQEDYRTHLKLREENILLKEVETWRKRIRHQSWFVNLAMITKWVFRKD